MYRDINELMNKLKTGSSPFNEKWKCFLDWEEKEIDLRRFGDGGLERSLWESRGEKCFKVVNRLVF